jgi:hypothetical protein
MKTLPSLMALGLITGLMVAAVAAVSGEPAGRVEIKLPHKGDVFGEGPEWDAQYAREALQIFQDLKPDPAWVAKLRELPDNTWMRCPKNGDQWRERRGDIIIEYIPDVHACFATCGCGNPGYSSDTWLYHTGANRWVQMWPNWIKGGRETALNKGPYPTNRPAGRCSGNFGYDPVRKKMLLRGGANAGQTGGRITWEYDPATNQWERVAPENVGFQRYEDNCLGFAPGFGLVEIGGNRNFEKEKYQPATWVYRSPGKWETLKTTGFPPGGNNCHLVWASGPQKLIYFAHGDLYAFDPKALTWENLNPTDGPRPAARERHGIAYDSANDVVLITGGAAGKALLDSWVYSFADKKWTELKQSDGKSMPPGHEPTCYDSEYNVFVTALGDDMRVYRYKRAKTDRVGNTGGE